MTPYILSLVAASLAAALCELLAPRGEGGRIAASVRMTAGLFVLVALLSPLRAVVDFFANLSEDSLDIPEAEAPDYESVWQSSLLSLGTAELVAWAESALASELGIDPAHAEVLPVFADAPSDAATPPPLLELCIVLDRAAILENPHPIEDYFASALGVPCRVSVALS